MFTTFFKMTAQPFSERLPATELLQDERMTQALARLNFMAQYATIALISGEQGVGKSSLLKLFINSLGKNQYQPVYVHLTNLKEILFLKMLVTAMGEMPARGKEKTFLQIINKTKEKDLTTIIIIDEAHLLKSETLIDLRLLVSSAMDNTDRLKIVLSGHTDLKKELQRSCHSALLQRITVKYHIHALTQTQTHHYIDFHMHRVGSSEKIFDQEVKTLICQYSRGIPRLINNIATACLLNAACNNSQKVTQDILTQSLEELQPL